MGNEGGRESSVDVDLALGYVFVRALARLVVVVEVAIFSSLQLLDEASAGPFVNLDALEILQTETLTILTILCSRCLCIFSYSYIGTFS